MYHLVMLGGTKGIHTCDIG